MKKKTQLNEVRQLQKIAGLLKEDQSQVDDIVDTIVDWAGSGQGNVSGLEQGAPEIRQMLASISANPDLLDQVTKALQAYIDSSEGWTRDDIAILNKLGLSVSKGVADGDENVKDQIEKWYWKTNRYIDIDDLSPEQIEDGIQAHYEEWMAVKDQYDSIQDYFDDVERNQDWY